MFCFYAAKGGVGCSVVAAAAAVLSSADLATLLVDLGGDQPCVLGLSEPSSTSVEPPGISEWLRAESPLPDTLHRLERQVTDSLSLLPLGSGPFDPRSDQARLLARILAADGRRVVIDLGTSAPGGGPLLEASDHALLVTRACYLGLRAARLGPEPDAVVLVAEPGRALSAADVASALGRPIGAVIRWDPSIARSVDAGLLASRLPRPFRELVPLLSSTAILR